MLWKYDFKWLVNYMEKGVIILLFLLVLERVIYYFKLGGCLFVENLFVLFVF